MPPSPRWWTFTRAFEDPSLPGVYSRAQEPVGQGSRIEHLRFRSPAGYLATAEQWAYREDIEAALTRSIARHGPFDVAHLRFADVGTFAAARVFRRLGVPVVFTLAPDPHSVLRESEAAGRLDRETFPAADLEHHYVFRAWLIGRNTARGGRVGGAAPSPGAERELRALLGPSGSTPSVPTVSGQSRRGSPWTQQRGQPVAQDAPAIRSLCTAVGSLPERRLGLPLLVTVARLNRVKGIPQLVEAWAGDAELLEGFNLVVVGGDLDQPTGEERPVLSEDAVCASGCRLPARASSC